MLGKPQTETKSVTTTSEKRQQGQSRKPVDTAERATIEACLRFRAAFQMPNALEYEAWAAEMVRVAGGHAKVDIEAAATEIIDNNERRPKPVEWRKAVEAAQQRRIAKFPQPLLEEPLSPEQEAHYVECWLMDSKVRAQHVAGVLKCRKGYVTPEGMNQLIRDLSPEAAAIIAEDMRVAEGDWDVSYESNAGKMRWSRKHTHGYRERANALQIKLDTILL